MQRLTRDARVTVTGQVADTRPYLRRAAVVVAPLRIARGVQNKVLEGLAMGVPVGSDIEFADEVTMWKAMEGRREI